MLTNTHRSDDRHALRTMLATTRRWPLLIAGLALSGQALFGVGAAVAQLAPPPQPAGNPLTASKALLGKVLFWDEQLSSTRTVSCGTCHIPSAGGDDPRSMTNPLAVNPGPDATFGTADDVLGSPGVPSSGADGLYLWNTHFGLTEQATGRRTTSALNAGYASDLFWDGRAGDEFLDPVTLAVVLPSGAALESQAVGPVVSEVEMGHVARAWSEVVIRLTESAPLALAPRAPIALLDWLEDRSYPELFDEAFGTPEISAARVAMAIASYERTQFTNQAPFDDFIAGLPALTPLETQGRGVFVASSCDRCHSLALTSDNLFHYTGVRPVTEDPGRFAVTADPDDMGRMRTPSLRNLELRAPYMHNGRFGSIEEVVDFYDRGGDFDAPNKDNRVRPLMLTQGEKDALVAFLKRPLTDPRVAPELPPFDRPPLFTESDLVPTVEGAGVAGGGGLVPQPVALEPPLVGNPSFTVGLYDALGGAPALLVIDDVDPGLAPPASGDLAFVNVTLGGVGAGMGFGSASVAIPADAALAGSEWFGRWYVDESGSGGGTAVSPLIRLTIFESLQERVIFVDQFDTGDFSDWSAVVP